MKYISSDTNVWLDFKAINKLDLPFLLDYIYLMNDEAVENELLSPPNLGSELTSLGLRKTELTSEEFFLAEELNIKYAKPSIYDCIALAIAKVRHLTLLSGDGPLRKAAKMEGVKVMGTIGILDQLYTEAKITQDEYHTCIKGLLQLNGGKVRLSANELEKRLKSSIPATINIKQ